MSRYTRLGICFIGIAWLTALAVLLVPHPYGLPVAGAALVVTLAGTMSMVSVMIEMRVPIVRPSLARRPIAHRLFLRLTNGERLRDTRHYPEAIWSGQADLT